MKALYRQNEDFSFNLYFKPKNGDMFFVAKRSTLTELVVMVSDFYYNGGLW